MFKEGCFDFLEQFCLVFGVFLALFCISELAHKSTWFSGQQKNGLFC
jgi:hypothetical protein